MYNQTFLILIKRGRVILLSGLILAVVSLLLSFISPLQYRADAQILIISKSRYGVDPYTVVKSAERVGENLVAVFKTNDFFSKVISYPGAEIDKSKFENVTERVKRQRWQETVKGSVVYGTGVLNVSTYAKSQDEAIKLTGAVAAVLVSQGYEYVGDDVSMKVVNDPVATRFPVKPNLLLNFLLGFFVGAVLMMVIVVRKYRV